MVLSPKTVTIPTTGQSMVVYVVSLEYRGPEEQLAQIGYEIAKRRIEHQIRMGTVETQARRLLVAPHEETIQDQQERTAEIDLLMRTLLRQKAALDDEVVVPELLAGHWAGLLLRGVATAHSLSNANEHATPPDFRISLAPF